MMVTGEVPAQLVVDAPRQVHLVQGMKYDLHWRLLSDDPDLRPAKKISIATPGARKIRINQGTVNTEQEKSGVLTLVTTVATPPMKFNVILNTEVDIQDCKRNIYAPAITVEVVQGYEIVVPSTAVTVSPGGKAELVARIQRDPAFLAAVEIKAENLPLGASCLPVKVTGSEEEFRVFCQAGPAAVPGEYNIELTSSSMLAGRDQEKVPYRIEPVKAPLVVSSQEGT